ncbi:substrate-binding periplasmic protein [Pseudomonas sp. BMS12]|uniref:substrate-binding periplasmic protein n=1 Tax=Pseudomonas sp. BMS12 TaxID=1796033 RepID=UPI00083B68BC|nr:transporter substrate-binding domain-containing protein [Pseudomonas sp. BMS12]
MRGLRAVVLCAALLLGQSVAAEHLRLVGDAWPPFTDTALSRSGLAVDLVSSALRRAGHSTEYVQVPWARVLLGLQQGDYDIIVAAWYSDERSRYGLYSKPYLSNRVRFLRRSGSSIEFHGLDSLLPHSIAVVRGYSYAPEFDADSRLHKVPVLEFAMGARMLAAGRVQLTLEDELVGQYYLNHDLQGIRNSIEFVGPPLSENGLHILMRRSHPLHKQIIADFDREIAAMQADGSYQGIFKYHGL